MKKCIIAIDGPAGAGKSTVAQIVAQRLTYTYIDTGSMYRAVTWQAIRNGLISDSIIAEKEIGDLAHTMEIKLTYLDGMTFVYVNEVDVTQAIRMPEVTRLVAEVAQIYEVREAMLNVQRQMANQGAIVMDGRDICTHVLPNADVKIFLTASIEERAKRRCLELTNKGFAIDLEQVKLDIADRDKKDCERVISPLIQAPDAVLLDTTNLSIEGAVLEILKLCEG